MSTTWVDAAQVASGLAAVVALVFAGTTVRESRRAPLAEAYLEAWQTILDIVNEASRPRFTAPEVEHAQDLERAYHAADDRLAVMEAALGVKIYGREIRHYVTNILIDVLFEDTETRMQDLQPFTDDWFPPPKWADPATWPQVGTSIAINCLLLNMLFERPGRLNSDDEGMFRWYVPRVVEALNNPHSVYSPKAEPQQQLARLLSDFNNDFLLPWVRDATREALLGRRGLAGNRVLLTRYRARAVSRLRGRSTRRYEGPTIFGS